MTTDSALRYLLVAWIAVAAAACDRPTGTAAPVLTFIDFPGPSGSAQPRLTHDVEGNPVLSWLSPAGDATSLRFARFARGELGESQEVAQSERMFENWVDFPSVTPITRDLWFAHWLELRPGSFSAYDIATTVSRDGGRSWSAGERMNEDETLAEHGFASVFAWDDGIAAFWLDGRDLANWSLEDPDALLAVSLRLARYAPGGTVTSREIVDELVCDCCQPDVAMAAEGPILVYRDRSEDEVRDVVFRRYADAVWSEPVGLGNEGWRIEACPINGPVVAAAADAAVAVWFTAADDRPRLRLAQSSDSGRNFGDAVDVDSTGVLGQPAVALDADGRAVVIWWRRGYSGGIDLAVRTYTADGTAGPLHLVAHEGIGQAISVPQLAVAGDDYLLAWTTLDDSGTVRVALLELDP